MNDSKGNLLLYQTEDGQTKIEVTLANDTVWLTADQMAELFQRNKSTISRHIKNVLESEELKPDMVVAFFATTTRHGAIKGKTQTHTTAFYNLDMIISEAIMSIPTGVSSSAFGRHRYYGNTLSKGLP